MKCLVSIIVPVYNAENFLSKCIDSILSQSFVDWELLLIDDGSTDSSWEIINKYISNDKRIKAYHKENGGAGSARNEGIKRATGKWMLFVDADDYVEKDYIEKLVSASKGVDLTICGMKLICGEKITYSKIYLDGVEKKERLTVEDFFNIIRIYTLSGPVCKLFCSDIIKNNNIYFPTDINLGEDSIFVYTYLQYVNTTYIIDNYYGYNVMLSQNEKSLTKKAKPQDRIDAYKRIYKTGCHLLKTKSLKGSVNLDLFFVDGLLQAINQCKRDNILLSAKERYSVYDSIAELRYTKELAKRLPFYFLFFKKFRVWRVYEFLNNHLYK